MSAGGSHMIAGWQLCSNFMFSYVFVEGILAYILDSLYILILPDRVWVFWYITMETYGKRQKRVA